MIIAEGPDGAGKTTLVNHLRGKYGLTVGQRGTHDRTKLWTVTVKDTFRALSYAVESQRMWPAQVWDRLYYSEMVYAPVTGREVQFNPSQRSFIERIINAAGFPVILCLPPLTTVAENSKKNTQMDGVLDNIERIYGGYVELWQDHDIFPADVMVYDYTGTMPGLHNLEEAEAHIEDYLDEHKERSWS